MAFIEIVTFSLQNDIYFTKQNCSRSLTADLNSQLDLDVKQIVKNCINFVALFCNYNYRNESMELPEKVEVNAERTV